MYPWMFGAPSRIISSVVIRWFLLGSDLTVVTAVFIRKSFCCDREGPNLAKCHIVPKGRPWGFLKEQI